MNAELKDMLSCEYLHRNGRPTDMLMDTIYIVTNMLDILKDANSDGHADENRGQADRQTDTHTDGQTDRRFT